MKNAGVGDTAHAGCAGLSTWDVNVLEVLGRMLGYDSDELWVEVVRPFRLKALVPLPKFRGRQGPELLGCGRDSLECDLGATAAPRRIPSSSFLSTGGCHNCCGKEVGEASAWRRSCGGDPARDESPPYRRQRDARGGARGNFVGNEEDDLLATQKTAPQLCRHVCGASEAKQEFLHIASCGPLGEATRGGIVTLTLGRQFEISILRRSPF